MADEMRLVITLSKNVPNKETAVQIYDLIKEKLSDHPEISIRAQISDVITEKDILP